ncbi:MAG: response regulator, partial [Phaeodactylibacter sp.]|nr:response regulator [Phaeodactylibacter sp.]
AAIAQEGEIPEPAVETETGAQEKRQASASRQSTILLVEDNPGLQDYIGMILSQHYQLVIASNGKEALDILQSEEQENINLILSDVMMPEVDGFTLVERIKQDEKLRHLPTIMLTARAGQEDRLRALRIGVDDYILKPFEEEELLLRLENTLRNFHLRFEANTDAGLPEEKEENRQDEAWVPSPDRLSLEDQEWLAQLELATLKQVGNSSFNTDALADILAISRRQLFRKIKSLTGLTPNQYIQEVRLQRARRLLEQQAFSTVKAIAFNVGLKDVRYFSQQYRQRFGKLPSEYY